MTKPLILASGSAYRKQLLTRLGLAFETISPDIDESPLAGETFEQTAKRLAKEKALAVAREHPLAVVIGSDQVAHCGDVRLDKPGNAQAAFTQLMLQRGQISRFHTALCVATDGGGLRFEAMVNTDVRFKDATQLSEAALRDYIAKEEPFDCAGAAKSEGLGIALIASMHGPDPTALIGLPLIALTELLSRAGIHVLAR